MSAPRLAVGAELELAIEKPAAGGRMMARHAGQVVLVSGAIPGEAIKARVEEVAKGVAYAHVTEILDAAPERRVPAIDPRCGGNVYAHIAYPRQLQLKAEIVRDALARIGRLPLTDPISVAASPEHGYRMRARFHVRGARVGFFREASHQLCDAGSTGQLLPATVEVIEQVSRLMQTFDVRGIAEIELAENIPADQRALHFEMQPGLDPTGLDLRSLARVEPATGVTIGGGRRQEVVLRGRPFVADALEAIVPGLPELARTARLQRHVRAFFQANRYLLPALVAHVVRQVEEGPVLDLYSGVGLFAVAAAAAGRAPVVAVEGSGLNLADLAANAAPFSDRLRVEHAVVEAYLERPSNDRFASAIVDPPRTGLSRDAIEGLATHAPPRLVYVSCDPATLARDVRRLAERGYELRAADAFDLFPNTAHVETVAVLERGE